MVIHPIHMEVSLRKTPFRYKMLFLFVLLLPATSLGRLELVKPSEILMIGLIIMYCLRVTMQRGVDLNQGLPVFTDYLLLFIFYLVTTSTISPVIPEEVYRYEWYGGIFNENQNLFYLLRIIFLVMSYVVLMEMIYKYEHIVLIIKFIVISTIVYLTAISIVGLISPDLIFWQAEHEWQLVPLRLKGFSSEPNSFCAWLYSVFFLFLTLSTYRIEKLGVSQKLIRFFTGVLCICLILTFSTTGYLTIFFGCLVFLHIKRSFYRKVISRNISLKAIKIMGIASPIVIIILILWNHPLIVILRNVIGKVQILASITEADPRSILLVTNINTFLHYPLFGVGMGRSAYFTAAFYPFGSYSPILNPEEMAFRSLCAYTLILCETGIVGFVMLFVVFIKLLKYCRYKNLNLRGKIISLYVLPSLAAFMVGMLGSGDIQYQLYFVLTIVLLIKNYQFNRIADTQKSY